MHGACRLARRPGLAAKLGSLARVEVPLDRLLAGFDRAGFERRGRNFVSEGFDRARQTIEIEINAVFGDVDVIWLDPRD